MTNPDCYHRRDSQGNYCADCRARWDRDDTAPPCPRKPVTVATRAHDESIERSNEYVSALAPNRF